MAQINQNMTHGSLFSGIGGFDLAAEWMGWDNIFHCEWNPFGQKVLKHHFPNSISYNDITKTDFSIHAGKIDILTGGFPCQPYSSAGKRLGKADERHLFPEMLRCIKEVKPRYIVGENVRGLVSWGGGLVFNEVCDDLEREGYAVQPFLIPAASVGAPHQRQRIWFIAYSNGIGRGQDDRINNRESNEPYKDGETRIFTDSNINGGSEFTTNLGQEIREEKSRGDKFTNGFDNNGKEGHATNTIIKRLQGFPISGKISNKKRIMGEKENKSSIKFTSKNHKRDWSNFPTVTPICGGDDGLPRKLDNITFSKWRIESIKAYGNAIVPQVAYQIFKAICNCETTKST
jgi:DNA (cytosine-5)-methyltransferase 1